MENRINHIIARVLSGESSSDDILSLSEWLNENEKNRDEFRRLKNYWDADVAFKHSVAPAFSADKLQQKINVQRRQTARRQLWRNAIPLIAAACLLFIFSTACGRFHPFRRRKAKYRDDPKPTTDFQPVDKQGGCQRNRHRHFHSLERRSVEIQIDSIHRIDRELERHLPSRNPD